MKSPLAARGAPAALVGVLMLLMAGGGYALAGGGAGTIRVCLRKGTRIMYGAPCHRHDHRLSWSRSGRQGRTGQAGRAGPPGATGAPGPTGPAGPQGVTGVGGWSGAVGTITAGGTAAPFVFAGPTVLVATSANQSIVASGSVALGASAGAPLVDVSLCVAPNASAPTPAPLDANSNGAYDRVLITSSNVYASSQTGAPGAGIWQVGMCVRNWSPVQDIDKTDFSIGYAFVTNGTPVSQVRPAAASGAEGQAAGHTAPSR